MTRARSVKLATSTLAGASLQGIGQPAARQWRRPPMGVSRNTCPVVVLPVISPQSLDVEGELQPADQSGTGLDQIFEIADDAVLPDPRMKVEVRVVRIAHHLATFGDTGGDARDVSRNEGENRDTALPGPKEGRGEVARGVAGNAQEAAAPEVSPSTSGRALTCSRPNPQMTGLNCNTCGGMQVGS